MWVVIESLSSEVFELFPLNISLNSTYLDFY